MRKTLLILVVLSLCASVGAGASTAAGRGAGSLSIEGGRGQVTLRGTGAVLGRVDRGTVQVVDLTPGDRWVPTVNVGGKVVRSGAPVVVNGEQISFRLLGGQYRIIVRGDGISLSAIGKGNAKIIGAPDATGAAGVYAAGNVLGGGTPDCLTVRSSCIPIAGGQVRVEFGGAVVPNVPEATVRPKS
jgi:hypothetical protein